MAKRPEEFKADLVGTYKLLDTKLTLLDTGQTIPKNDSGYIHVRAGWSDDSYDPTRGQTEAGDY
jgi:hypothetical protein